MGKNIFRCDITNESLCLKCDACKVKALILKDELCKIEDDIYRTILQRRYLHKETYNQIMCGVGIKELYKIKNIIRNCRKKIKLETDPTIDIIIQKYKREENLKSILA